jgi:hypothetical protein
MKFEGCHFNPDNPLEKTLIPALRQAQDKLAFGQAGIQQEQTPREADKTSRLR